MNKECPDCPIQQIYKFHKAMEGCFFSHLPPEVSQPLQTAKQQLLLAAKGFIEHELNNLTDEVSEKSRAINVE
ncbi:MAG: hypothetical protein LLG02_06290 [Pelosinus sp.]|nr:hypothetical protein [Pelosinus sp.]